MCSSSWQARWRALALALALVLALVGQVAAGTIFDASLPADGAASPTLSHLVELATAPESSTGFDGACTSAVARAREAIWSAAGLDKARCALTLRHAQSLADVHLAGWSRECFDLLLCSHAPGDAASSSACRLPVAGARLCALVLPSCAVRSVAASVPVSVLQRNANRARELVHCAAPGTRAASSRAEQSESGWRVAVRELAAQAASAAPAAPAPVGAVLFSRRIVDASSSNKLIWADAEPLPPDSPPFYALALAAISDVYSLMARTLHLLSYDGNNGSVVLAVHTSSPACPNAFYQGSGRLGICDGFEAADIVAHEFGHGFYAQVGSAGTGSPEHGVFSEAFADLVAFASVSAIAGKADDEASVRAPGMCSAQVLLSSKSAFLTLGGLAAPTIAVRMASVYRAADWASVLPRRYVADVADASGSFEWCTDLAPGDVSRVAGRVALIERGTCDFKQKVAIAQRAGAVAVIFVNTEGLAFPTAGVDRVLPAGTVSHAIGSLLRSVQAVARLTASVAGPNGSEPTLGLGGVATQPSTRWLIGAALPTGAIRDAWWPPCLNYAARLTDADFDCNNEAHINSMLVTHPFAALVDGLPGVPRIGVTKAFHIFMRAFASYAGDRSFAVFGTALRLACADLAASASALASVRPGGADEVVRASDCLAVAAAVAQAQLQRSPHCAYAHDVFAQDDEAAARAVGAAVFNVHANLTTGWTLGAAVVGLRSISPLVQPLVASPYADGRPAVAASLAGATAWAQGAALPLPQSGLGLALTAGESCVAHELQGLCRTHADARLVLGGAPPGDSVEALVQLVHAPSLGPDSTVLSLAIALNDGPWQTVPRSSFLANAPPTRVDAAAHPLAGQMVWSGSVAQVYWGTTTARLPAAARPGDTVRVRLECWQDAQVARATWYVSAVRLGWHPLTAAPASPADGVECELSVCASQARIPAACAALCCGDGVCSAGESCDLDCCGALADCSFESTPSAWVAVADAAGPIRKAPSAAASAGLEGATPDAFVSVLWPGGVRGLRLTGALDSAALAISRTLVLDNTRAVWRLRLQLSVAAWCGSANAQPSTTAVRIPSLWIDGVELWRWSATSCMAAEQAGEVPFRLHTAVWTARGAGDELGPGLHRLAVRMVDGPSGVLPAATVFLVDNMRVLGDALGDQVLPPSLPPPPPRSVRVTTSGNASLSSADQQLDASVLAAAVAAAGVLALALGGTLWRWQRRRRTGVRPTAYRRLSQDVAVGDADADANTDAGDVELIPVASQ